MQTCLVTSCTGRSARQRKDIELRPRRPLPASDQSREGKVTFVGAVACLVISSSAISQPLLHGPLHVFLRFADTAEFRSAADRATEFLHGAFFTRRLAVVAASRLSHVTVTRRSGDVYIYRAQGHSRRAPKSSFRSARRRAYGKRGLPNALTNASVRFIGCTN
jgi:hypothetical protein